MSPQYASKVVTNDYQVQSTDDLVLVDMSSIPDGGNLTLFMPSGQRDGWSVNIKHVNGPLDNRQLIVNASNAGGIEGSDQVAISIPHGSVQFTAVSGFGFIRSMDYYGV